MPRAIRSILPVLASLLAAGAAGAQDVTVGGPADHTNGFPFTGYNHQLPNRYQQVYAASGFSQPVFIDAIRFANTVSTAGGLPGSIAGGEYLVRLSVTSAAVNGLSTDFDANVTSPSQVFFAGMLTTGGLRIDGDDFRYDPTLGNLLLDVIVYAQPPVGFFGLDASRSATDGTSRVYSSFPPPWTPPFPVAEDDFGLVTTFETRASVVPEPGTVVLLATGLGALAVVGARRRSRPVT
jgi:hypothetical protein